MYEMLDIPFEQGGQRATDLAGFVCQPLCTVLVCRTVMKGAGTVATTCLAQSMTWAQRIGDGGAAISGMHDTVYLCSDTV